MAGHTMIMGDDDLGPCQGEHPTPRQSICCCLELAGREEKKPFNP